LLCPLFGSSITYYFPLTLTLSPTGGEGIKPEHILMLPVINLGKPIFSLSTRWRGERAGGENEIIIKKSCPYS
jgi:hypothetical protein